MNQRTSIPPRLFARTALILSLFVPAVSTACPDCPVGRTARQQVLEQGFAQNLSIALAPFLLITAVSLAAERIGKPRWSPQNPQT